MPLRFCFVLPFVAGTGATARARVRRSVRSSRIRWRRAWVRWVSRAWRWVSRAWVRWLRRSRVTTVGGSAIAAAR